MSRNEHQPKPNYVPRKLPVRKVDVSTVAAVLNPDMVSRNGRTVWAGFDGERVVCLADNADECRALWRGWDMRMRLQQHGRGQREVPQNLEG